MRNFKIICILLIVVSSKLSAQKTLKKVDDLTFLYVDEKYQDVVYKGEGLMQNDAYKKHPLVYIYTSMSYYEMSRRPGKFDVGDKDSKFPKPLKMAQKHLYKFVKLDKKAPKLYDNSWYADFEEYYVLLADTSNKLAQMLYLNEKYRKSASSYKYAYRAVPSDPVLQLWQGIGEMKSKNTVEGKKTLVAALKQIDENFVPSTATSGVLPRGLLLAEEIFRGKMNDYVNADKAKKLMEVFKKYDADELDKKKMEARIAKEKEAAEKAMNENRVMRNFMSDEKDEDNKDRKGKTIIKDGRGSEGNGSKSDDDELDQMEKDAKEDGK